VLVRLPPPAPAVAAAAGGPCRHGLVRPGTPRPEGGAGRFGRHVPRSSSCPRSLTNFTNGRQSGAPGPAAPPGWSAGGPMRAAHRLAVRARGDRAVW